MNFTKTTLFSFLLFIFLSCHKENVSTRNQHLNKITLESRDDSVIKLNQAIFIRDTELKDSIHYASPPTNRYFKWKVSPDKGCAFFDYKFRYGLAEIKFSCPGNYQICAEVYDSLSNQLIAITDTFYVEVINETLATSQRIYPNDTLLVKPEIITLVTLLDNGDPARYHKSIALNFSTSKLYEYAYNQLTDMYIFHPLHHYSILFTDTIRLATYPSAYGIGKYGVVSKEVHLFHSRIGITSTINITWLGKSFTGKITLINDNEYSLDWINTGLVKFIN